nr:hypothetical protein [Tanacetum cinerariifolium]
AALRPLAAGYHLARAGGRGLGHCAAAVCPQGGWHYRPAPRCRTVGYGRIRVVAAAPRAATHSDCPHGARYGG